MNRRDWLRGLEPFCRGDKATLTERRGADLYLFQNVPAQVCTACGEIWIEEATLQEIDRLIREGEPIRKVATPVYDFAVAGAK